MFQSTCPLQMQSLSIIGSEFSHPSSAYRYYGDLKFYQISHLPCLRNHVDLRYNNSIMDFNGEINNNIVDYIMDEYFKRTGIVHLFVYSHNQS